MTIREFEIDPLFFLAIIWKKRKQITLITTCILILGVLYAFLATPWYQATVKILPTNENSGKLSQYSGLAAMFGVNIPSSLENKHILYPDIILSNFVLDRVLQQRFKTSIYKKPVTLLEFWETELDSSEQDWKHIILEKSKKKLRKNYIEAEIDDNTQILYLNVKVPNDPVFSAQLANYITKQLEYYNNFVRKYKATEQRVFIEKSISETKQELEKAQRNLKNFKEKNKNVFSPEIELGLEILETENEVQKNIYIELKKQLEISKIEEIKETEILEILEYATVPIEKIKPRRILIILSFLFIGFLLAIIYTILMHLYIIKKEKIYNFFKMNS